MSSDVPKSSTEGVIIVSDGLSPEHIIQKILDVDALPVSDISCNNVKGYPWKFETKYYTAEINLYGVQEKISLEPSFTDTIKAFIFYFDSTKVNSYENILEWVSFFEIKDAEVRLLVCNNCAEDSVYPELSRKNILNWCAKEQFELVELNPVEVIDEEDDFIPEAKGYARIVQALQTHTWSNLAMKEKKCPVGNERNENKISEEKSVAADRLSNVYNKEDEECAKGTVEEPMKKSEDKKKIKVGSDELSLEENWLNNVVSGDDPGGESFEALFSKFASMKDRAEGLTGDARKKYAEQVAIAFWKAMGGDEDEIEGLDE